MPRKKDWTKIESTTIKIVTKVLFSSSSDSECETWKPSGGSTDYLNSDISDDNNIFKDFSACLDISKW